MNRTRPGSSSRAGHAVSENQRMLEDSVVRLEQELMESRAETKKVSDQLTCLMLLVQRYMFSLKNINIYVHYSLYI